MADRDEANQYRMYVSQYGDLEIHALPAFNDNYLWTLILFDKWVWVVDPGDIANFVKFMERRPYHEFAGIWVTHGHHDHMGDVGKLLEWAKKQPYENTPRVYAHPELKIADYPIEFDKPSELIGDFNFIATHVPGHTQYDVAFTLLERVMDDEEGGDSDSGERIQKHVFTGDMLFSAGSGRVFTGTMEELFKSFQWVNSLEDDVLLYPGHEYTLNNLKFAEVMDPQNEKIKERIANFKTPSVPVTLKSEREVNPFLRVGEESIKKSLKEKFPNLDVEDKFEVFKTLRELKNKF